MTCVSQTRLLPACLALLACAAPVPASGQAVPDPRVANLEQQLHDVQRELADLKAKQGKTAPGDPLGGLKQTTSARFGAIDKRFSQLPRIDLTNGRFTIISADGAFSLSLRSVVQFDAGYFAQGRNPAGVDFNSGTNFRRAQFGFVGTLWRDWSYNVTYDFGGSGAEKSGYLYRAYIEYDGLAPFGVRVGAFSPPAGIDDATGGANLVFLERATSANLARSIAAGSGREAITVYAQGSDYLLSLSYTGGKTTDAATFDEQQALVGRASYLAVDTADFRLLLDANASRVFKLPDVAAGANAPDFFDLNAGPELAVDGTRTVDTGAIDASGVTEYGFETAANVRRFYMQGGWFHYAIDRRTALPRPGFAGWYALATWSLTGETRRYDPVSASFRDLHPDHPLGTPGGFGAWEVKARYSNLDLDFMPEAAAGSGGIAGGIQNIWSMGLNWYPTFGLRFMLDYDNIRVTHVNAPAADISADAIALRSQLSF